MVLAVVRGIEKTMESAQAIKIDGKSDNVSISTTALICLVVGISDGDTLTARCGQAGDYEQVKVRIAAIDAPEKRQAFGNVSRQHLADLCFQQQATISPRSKDRYGRTVADVACQGKDVGREQVSAGLAWVYVRYTTSADTDLFGLEKSARASGNGLWRDSDPVAPWEWRAKKRS